MPAEPPPLQPSPAERWHIEEAERRRLLEWERQQAEERRWWESLSPQQREEVERQRERERAEAEARQREAARRQEELDAAHRQRVASYEEAHGGAKSLCERQKFLERRLAGHPNPTALSTGGTLLVLMLAALIPGLLFNAVFDSPGGGILFAELLTLAGWAIWVQRRRERVRLRTATFAQLADLTRQLGCGDVECRQCYPDQSFRTRWKGKRTEISRGDGCGAGNCGACYPALQP